MEGSWVFMDVICMRGSFFSDWVRFGEELCVRD